MGSSASPRFRANSSSKKSGSSSQGSMKKSGTRRSNTSILSFFKKADGPPKSNQNRITQYVARREDSGSRRTGRATEDNGDGSESLFFEDNTGHGNPASDGYLPRSTSPETHRSSVGDDENQRYNEHGGSMKRQKVEHLDLNAEAWDFDGDANTAAEAVPDPDVELRSSPKDAGSTTRQGPFLDESDSDSDNGDAFSDCRDGSVGIVRPKTGVILPVNLGANGEVKQPDVSPIAGEPTRSGSPKSDSSCSLGEAEGSTEIEGPEKAAIFSDSIDQSVFIPDGNNPLITDDDWGAPEWPSHRESTICPVCQRGLDDMTDTAASLHVNRCLDDDGDPVTPANNTTEPPVTKSEPEATLTRTERKVLARPGQENPFDINSETSSTSAFSKLMSANAEDSAWTSAAAKEEASRGKQAYERTCPFYKILPGFSICVDAFRYGAVENCNAYFLSHFHSDHYMGLNSSWSHGPIYCSSITGSLVKQQLKVDPKFVVDVPWDTKVEVADTDGVSVTMIPANHCPGSSLFLFEKNLWKGKNPKVRRILHCGDFRACPAHVQHPLLRPDVMDPTTSKLKEQAIDVCYLDTTYLNPKYAFPNQEDVVAACAEKSRVLDGKSGSGQETTSSGQDMTQYFSRGKTQTGANPKLEKGRLLVVIGTYSIGKERICVAIAQAMRSKIYVSAAKRRICACLEDEELSNLLTSDPLEAQVHLHSLMEMRSETLSEYLNSFKPRFSRVVGFRPTGWNYRPPSGRVIDNPTVRSVLHSESWKTPFSVNDLAPQRGSTGEALCFAVPYSEHSSFRELTAFCCALRISRVIPTVNVASAKSREKMKMWVDRWEAEKKKSGLFKVEDGATSW